MPMGRLTFRCIRCRAGGMSKQCSTARAAAVRVCLSGIRQVGMKRELARADVGFALPTGKDRPRCMFDWWEVLGGRSLPMPPGRDIRPVLVPT